MNDGGGQYGWSESAIHALVLKSESWYLAMRILRILSALFTLPVASSVCSSAAIIFVQRNPGSRLSLRQVMVLADRGWADPALYGRALTNWKRYGSGFLAMAMIANLLGLLVYPLQEGFLSSKTIKTATYPQQLLGLLDIPDQWRAEQLTGANDDNNLVVVLTRESLKTANPAGLQTQLWPGAGQTCNILDYIHDNPPAYCNQGMSFETMFDYTIEVPSNPFLAELPSGFNTGLIQQFLPRINSTANYEKISNSDYPAGCDNLPGAFFAQYFNSSALNASTSCSDTWGLQACMPGNMTQSPWKPTRARQDFSEVLYLNVTLTGCESDQSGLTNAFYRVTVNTTGGYFELPNYMNGGLSGPLLEDDPNTVCGDTCETEGGMDNIA